MPILSTKDPIDRAVDFVPTKAPYDPRWMLAGRPSQSEFTDFVIILWIWEAKHLTLFLLLEFLTFM